MTVLGIDPGIAIVGFGVVLAQKGKPVHVRHGAITTPKEDSLSRRLVTIHEDLTELIDTFKPDVVAVEELFWGTNVTTGISVSHGRGVILMTIQEKGLPMFEYTPMQVKQAVVGYGKAEKKQVMDMVRQLLKLNKMPRPDDAADALAVAICHVHSAGNVMFGR